MVYPFYQSRDLGILVLALILSQFFLACSSGEKAKNYAKESAARYWQDKAYPGKAFDVNVIEAEKIEGGQFRVKGLVDGETRVGVFNPETETFSEGYYSLAHERNKKIAELEEEVKYYKERSEALEKENYKLKVKLGMDDQDEDQKGSKKQKPKKNPTSQASKKAELKNESTHVQDDEEDDSVGLEQPSVDKKPSAQGSTPSAAPDAAEPEKKRQ